MSEDGESLARLLFVVNRYIHNVVEMNRTTAAASQPIAEDVATGARLDVALEAILEFGFVEPRPLERLLAQPARRSPRPAENYGAVLSRRTFVAEIASVASSRTMRSTV